jgi:hypothetical protein
VIYWAKRRYLKGFFCFYDLVWYLKQYFVTSASILTLGFRPGYDLKCFILGDKLISFASPTPIQGIIRPSDYCLQFCCAAETLVVKMIKYSAALPWL